MPVNTLVVGHRGASSVAPENTLAAFHLAFSEGAEWVEGDARLTNAGRVVFIHDKTTERVTNGKHILVVEDTSYATLAKLDVGSWKAKKYENESIPLLEDVLKTLPAGKGILIELKGESNLGEAAARVVASSECDPGQVIFISFDARALCSARAIAPAYSVWLVASFSQVEPSMAWLPSAQEVIAEAIRVGASGIDVQAHRDVINKGFVTEVHRSGLSLNVWTVDDPTWAQKLASLGVASITTNTPRVIREAIK